MRKLNKRQKGVMMEVLDLPGASEYLKLAHSTLYKYLQNGVIPGFKVGRVWRFKRSVLDDWMKQSTEDNVAAIAKKRNRQL